MDINYNNIVGVDDAVGALTQIASTVASIQDQNKRRAFEQNLALLDNRQKMALEKELQSTNNVNKRLEILYNAVSNIRSAQTSAYITSSIQARVKRERTIAIVVVGGAIVLLIGVILYKRS
jgi:hypothetical protein